MSPKAYPLVDPTKSLVPGSFSLVLKVQFRNPCQCVKTALASATFHMAFLPAALTTDTEPSLAQEVTILHKWSEQTYYELRAELVVLKYHPQQEVSH